MWNLVVSNVKCMVEILAGFYRDLMGVEIGDIKHFDAVSDDEFSNKEMWNAILRDYIRILEHVRRCVADAGRGECALIRDVVGILYALIDVRVGSIGDDLFSSENLATVRAHISNEIVKRDTWRSVNRDVNVCLQAVGRFCMKHLSRVEFRMIEDFEIWCFGAWIECHTRNLRFLNVILLRMEQKFVRGFFDTQIDAIDMFSVFLRRCIDHPHSVTVDRAWDVCMEIQMKFFEI